MNDDDFTYSVTNDTENHQYAIVVYYRPGGILSANQTEIGRAVVSDVVMKGWQNAGSATAAIGNHVERIKNEFRQGKMQSVLNSFVLSGPGGDTLEGGVSRSLKEQAYQEVVAEFGDALPVMTMIALIKRTGELMYAELGARHSDEVRRLRQELQSMKGSILEATVRRIQANTQTERPLQYSRFEDTERFRQRAAARDEIRRAAVRDEIRTAQRNYSTSAASLPVPLRAVYEHGGGWSDETGYVSSPTVRRQRTKPVAKIVIDTPLSTAFAVEHVRKFDLD